MTQGSSLITVTGVRYPGYPGCSMNLEVGSTLGSSQMVERQKKELTVHTVVKKG